MTLQFNNHNDFIFPNKIRVKSFIIVDGKPFQIVKISGPIKDGKHGSAKYIFDALELLTRKKKITCYRSGDKIPVPILEKMNLAVIDIDDDYMSLMDNYNRLFEGVPLPDNDIGKQIVKKYTKVMNRNEDKQLVVVIRGFNKSYDILSCHEED